MPCYHPLSAGRSKLPDPKTGKHKIAFHPKYTAQYQLINLPCGRCRGCRHEHARQWAVRCVHESQLYLKNCFITLTFNEKNLNSKGSLVKSDFQNFMKRLRKHYFGNTKSDVRYFHCGEYGADFGRPHHHACLFNFDFPDKTPWQNNLFRSKTLEMLWPHGYSSIGAVTYESAAYVARYIIKKINGKMAPDHYQGRQPEYTTMSRRPGIASEWFKKFGKTDAFPRDYIVLNGQKSKIPKYYNKIYELTNPELYGTIRLNRINKAQLNPNNHPDRLLAAEKIQEARDLQLQRGFEEQCLSLSKFSPSTTKKPLLTCNPSTSTTKPKRYVLSKIPSKMKSLLSPNIPVTSKSSVLANGMTALDLSLHLQNLNSSKNAQT